MSRLFLILTGVICFSYSFGLVNAGPEISFSDLQLEKEQSNMQLEISKLELEKLKVQSEIDKLSGITKQSQNISISVNKINIFNNNKQAVISIDGVVNTYNEGDSLKGDLVLNKVFSKSIDVLNTQTQKHTKYVIK